jgi:hypothetical protein
MRARRTGSLGLTLTLLAIFSFAGCSKSSQNPAAPNFTQSSDSSGSGPATAPSSGQGYAQDSGQSSANSSSQSFAQSAPQPSAQPAPPPQPVYVTVPPGTNLHVVLDRAISSVTAHAGDTFTATLVRSVMVGGNVVIPRNARVSGHVVEAVSSGRLSRQARLVLTLDSVQIGGASRAIQTSSVSRLGKAHVKRNVIAIGGGSALGAIIGGIAGGGKGAAIGAAAGAGAGTAGAAITGKENLVLPAEDPLVFQLQAPISVRE